MPVEPNYLYLTGANPAGAPVIVTLLSDPSPTGEIEEQVNATAGLLDLMPFAAGGSADAAVSGVLSCGADQACTLRTASPGLTPWCC